MVRGLQIARQWAHTHHNLHNLAIISLPPSHRPPTHTHTHTVLPPPTRILPAMAPHYVSYISYFNQSEHLLFSNPDPAVASNKEAICLVVDLSGSIKFSKLECALRTAVASLLVGAEGVEHINFPEPAGPTNLICAVDAMRERMTPGQTMYIFTDGHDNMHQGTLQSKTADGVFAPVTVDFTLSPNPALVADHLEFLGVRVCILALGKQVAVNAYLNRHNIHVAAVSSGADLPSIAATIKMLTTASRGKQKQMAVISVGANLDADLQKMGKQEAVAIENAISTVTIGGAAARIVCPSDLKATLREALSTHPMKAQLAGKEREFFGAVFLFLHQAAVGPAPPVMITSRHASIIGEITGLPVKILRPIVNSFMVHLCTVCPEFKKAGRTTEGGVTMKFHDGDRKYPGGCALYECTALSPSLVKVASEDAEFSLPCAELPAPKPPRSPSSSPKRRTTTAGKTKRGARKGPLHDALKQASGASA